MPVALSPEAPILPQILDAQVGPITRSLDGYFGPPPDRRDMKKEEELDREYLRSRYRRRRRISLYPMNGGG